MSTAPRACLVFLEASSSKYAFKRMREATIFDSIRTRHAKAVQIYKESETAASRKGSTAFSECFHVTLNCLSYEEASFHARPEAPSGTSHMPDGGGGRIVIGLVRQGPF